MTKKILILAGIILIMPVFCFAVSYERTPGYYSITNPITFKVDIGDACYGQSWKINTFKDPYALPPTLSSPCYSTSTTSQTWNTVLPIENYVGVSYSCYSGDNCTPIPPLFSSWLEYETGNIIFKVGEYSIFPSANISGILAYANRLFIDLKLLIVLAMGLPVAFWGINKAIGLITRRTKTRN